MFASTIMQSQLSDSICLTDYLIEDYDPKIEVAKSICLSNKTNSLQSSICSNIPEQVCFEEKIIQQNLTTLS